MCVSSLKRSFILVAVSGSTPVGAPFRLLWIGIGIGVGLDFAYGCFGVGFNVSFAGIRWSRWRSIDENLAATKRPALERMQLGCVHGECTALGEALIAIRTGVRLFAGVCPYMLG